MADVQPVKVSALPSANVLDGSEAVVMDQNGATVTGSSRAIASIPPLLNSGDTLDGSESIPMLQNGDYVLTTAQEIADLGGGSVPTVILSPSAVAGQKILFTVAGFFPNDAQDFVAEFESYFEIHINSGTGLNFNVEIPQTGITFAQLQLVIPSATSNYGPDFNVSVNSKMNRYTVSGTPMISVHTKVTVYTQTSGGLVPAPATFHHWEYVINADFSVLPLPQDLNCTVSDFGGNTLTFQNGITQITKTLV